MSRRVLLAAFLSVATFILTASVAEADICKHIPSFGVGPLNPKSSCEAVAHPQKTVEKVAESVGEAVSHPGKVITKAAGGVLSAPLQAAGGEVMQGVTSWVAEGAGWLVEQAGRLMNETTTPRIESPWFLQEYGAMGALAALFALPLLFLAIIQGVLRRDGVMIVRAVCVQLPLAFLLTAMAVTVVQLLLVLTDQMSSQIGATVGSDGKEFLKDVAKALVTAATATGSGNPVPLFAAFLAACVAAVGAFFVWVELLIRSAGIYVATLFLSFTFMGMIWEKTAHWCRRLVEVLGAIIFSKFVIVAIMVLAAAGLSKSGSSEAFQGVLAGIALLLLAALSPLALLRLLPFVESAAHTSWRSGTGSQTLGSIAGPAAVMRRVVDTNWGVGGGSGGGLQAVPAFAGTAAGIGAAETVAHSGWSRAQNIGGAAGRSDTIDASGSASAAGSIGVTQPRTTVGEGATSNAPSAAPKTSDHRSAGPGSSSQSGEHSVAPSPLDAPTSRPATGSDAPTVRPPRPGDKQDREV